MIFKKFNDLSKHTKIAIFVAPILLILGFGAADFWAESQANETRYYAMRPINNICDIQLKNCIVQSGEFKISIYLEDGRVTANATFPLDTMTLILVDENDVQETYPMGMRPESPYYWYDTTPLQDQVAVAGAEHKIRFVATVKGGQYFGEFVSTTASE